jgi:hypothetical protein
MLARAPPGILAQEHLSRHHGIIFVYPATSARHWPQHLWSTRPRHAQPSHAHVDPPT